MVWRYLFATPSARTSAASTSAAAPGIQAVQLALNGAAHVRALDVDQRAVANTLTNAFRNGVADRVSATGVDLYPWVPEERYEVIVASLYETPVDPFQQVTGHRPVDYWGRGLLDQLIGKLPRGARARGRRLRRPALGRLAGSARSSCSTRVGLDARVVDYSLFGFPPALADEPHADRARRGAQRRLPRALGEHDVMVAYLLEISRADAGEQAAARFAGEGR